MTKKIMKLSFGEKCGYGCGDFGSVLFWQTIMIHLLFFYTDVFGLEAKVAGVMFFVSRVLDAVFDVIIGMTADRTESRWGKFRPYILFGAIPLCVAAVFAFTTPDFGEVGKIVYAYATFILFMFLYSTVNIPYTSLLGVISGDPHERTKAASFKFVGAYLAGIIVSATALPFAINLGINSGTGAFTNNLTGLSKNTTYYVRAYAINEADTAYGNQISFKTLESRHKVITELISNVTKTSAKSGGNVISDIGEAVTARGVCWSTSENPSIKDDHTNDGSGKGSFTSNIIGLIPDTAYYVRAYAISSEDTAYGNQYKFITLDTITKPAVIITSITDITDSTATFGGNVTFDGGSKVTARGVCWSTSENPSVSDSHTADGNGIGEFASSLKGLSPNTTYYVRAYAINSADTGYGMQFNFSTGKEIMLPVVITAKMSSITDSLAQGSGNVISERGAEVKPRGLCWSTSENPTLADEHTIDITPANGWRKTMMIYAVAAFIFFMITFMSTRERIKPITKEKTNVKKDLKDIVKNVPWIMLFAVTILFILFVCIRLGVTNHYFKYYVSEQPVPWLSHTFNAINNNILNPVFRILGRTENVLLPDDHKFGFEVLASIFHTLGQVLSLIGVLLVPAFGKLVGRKKALIILFILALFFTGAFVFLKPGDLILIYLFQALGSITGGPISPLLWSMYADTADYSEWKTGRRATGLVFSASIMSNKLGWAFGSMIAAFILGMTGFVAGEIQSIGVKNGLRAMMSVIPVIAGVIALLIIIFFYKLDEATMTKIKEDLEERREEKE
jgi:Na+/melibiose symporter-like transporter